MDNTALFFQIFGLSRRWEFLDQLMIFGAEYAIYFTFLLIIILFFKGGVKEKKAFFLTAVGLLIAFATVAIIRIFYQEARPFVTYPITPLIDKLAALSFPSTHTLTMAIIAFAFSFHKSKFAPLLLFFLLWVGFARIYVGVHYPLDILGGIIIGLVSVKLAWLFKHFLKL